MFDRLINWFRERFGDDGSGDAPAAHATPGHTAAPTTKKVPRPNPEFVDADEELAGRIETNGPGKNVLVRNKYVREDTGTHETLKILDDSVVDSGEEPGDDPYNTGGFDRSRNWERRFGK